MKAEDSAKKIVDLVLKSVDNERDQCADLACGSNEKLINEIWNTSDLVYEKAGGEYWVAWKDIDIVLKIVAQEIRARKP